MCAVRLTFIILDAAVALVVFWAVGRLREEVGT